MPKRGYRSLYIAGAVVYGAYALDPLFPEWMEVDVPDSPFDEYLDLVEAARELGIHPQSLRRLIKQGRGPATRFAG